MKPTLRTGEVGQLSVTVRSDQTITLGGDSHATVFSTPSMIHLMEHAAREALRPHLEEGEESVGIDVQVKHTSATPPETQVTAEATVTMIEKNVVGFEIVARDKWGEIGRGTHRRAVIKTEGFAARLAEDKPVTQHVAAATTALPSTEMIELRIEGRLLQLTLNRRRKRNAINQQMTSELESLVDWLETNHDRVGVVIVSGAGGDFSAGDDVTDLQIDKPDQCAELSRRRGRLYQRMTRLPQLLIAAIDGLALGGGFVAVCACDLRIATHAAQLGLPEVKLGWPPNYGTRIVESLIGRGQLLRLAITGAIIDARKAEQLGIVHQTVPPARLQATADSLAQQILSLPPEAVAATKRLLSVSGDQSGDRDATEAFLQCLKSDAAKKSIARFS